MVLRVGSPRMKAVFLFSFFICWQVCRSAPAVPPPAASSSAGSRKKVTQVARKNMSKRAHQLKLRRACVLVSLFAAPPQPKQMLLQLRPGHQCEQKVDQSRAPTRHHHHQHHPARLAASPSSAPYTKHDAALPAWCVACRGVGFVVQLWHRGWPRPIGLSVNRAGSPQESTYSQQFD